MFNKYSSFISFIDVLLNLLLVYVFIAICALILIIAEKKTQTESNIVAKAEYIVTLEWDNESANDIDIWIKLPNNKVVFFNDKDSGNGIFLDRDDRGVDGDVTITENNEQKTIKINKEVLSFRAIIPGNYSINLHGYAIHKDPTRKVEKAKVVMMKLNPFAIVLEKEVEIRHSQEITLWNFYMDKDGKISNVTTIRTPMVLK